ncbi:hypothetical protein O181_092185 [Austropuccinia psidii MF-1]|uniref:Uncharacterized protein n=1 Tax=Austropuccinia psidii MF-1 TaxID=1389203 RepID=A0A9Q3P8V1_9BASI|nr:hypothetical protein [Austropuccinia psidii MF-1]
MVRKSRCGLSLPVIERFRENAGSIPAAHRLVPLPWLNLLPRRSHCAHFMEGDGGRRYCLCSRTHEHGRQQTPTAGQSAHGPRKFHFKGKPAPIYVSASACKGYLSLFFHQILAAAGTTRGLRSHLSQLIALSIVWVFCLTSLPIYPVPGRLKLPRPNSSRQEIYKVMSIYSIRTIFMLTGLLLITQVMAKLEWVISQKPNLPELLLFHLFPDSNTS